MLDRYSSGASVANHSNNWKKLVIAIIRIVLIYAVLSIAVTALFLHFIVPLATDMLGDLWGRILGAVLTITAIAPFLRAMIMKKNRSEEFKSLWSDSRFNHASLKSSLLCWNVRLSGICIIRKSSRSIWEKSNLSMLEDCSTVTFT